MQHTTPADIERTSMQIISQELQERGITLPEEHAALIRRVIHTTADFDYAETLYISPQAVRRGGNALLAGANIITDTNMARSGISGAALSRLGGKALCFMAEPEVAARAKENGTTRAYASMEMAAERYPGAVLAIGNAPTALYAIGEAMEKGLRPALVIAVPVGFVNVVEAKEEIRRICTAYDVPLIAAMGRKGGSNVAAAICNAVLYTVTDQLDPAKRGWN